MSEKFTFTDDDLIVLAHEKVLRENPDIDMNKVDLNASLYVENKVFKSLTLEYLSKE